MNTVFRGCCPNFLTEKWRHSRGIIILKVHMTRNYYYYFLMFSILQYV